MQLVDRHPNTPARRLLAGSRFRVCHQTTLDSVNKSHPCEPHIPLVLCSRSELSDAWVDYFVPGEIGSNDAEILVQSASYARYRLASCQSLLFCPVITFNRVSGVARVCFFHRGGVNSTRPCTLTGASEKADDFVEAIVGMLLWQDSLAAGIDRYRTQYSIYSTRFERFYILACIYALNDLRGRATHIYKVVPTGNLDEAESHQFEQHFVLPTMAHINANDRLTWRCGPVNERRARSAPPGVEAVTLLLSSPWQTDKRKAEIDNIFVPSKKAKYLGRTSENKENNVDRGYKNRRNPKDTALGAEVPIGMRLALGLIIIKESFPLESCDNNEVGMLKTVHGGRPNGAFGVVKMYGYETVPNSCYAVADSKHWSIFNDNVPALLPERRSLQRLYLEAGTPLDENRGPKRLVTAVFHAVIGVYF